MYVFYGEQLDQKNNPLYNFQLPFGTVLRMSS